MGRGASYQDIVRKLKALDARFQVFEHRGKGSHRMIYHPDINGEERSFPLPFHGNKTWIGPKMCAALKRRFALPDDFC